MVKKVFGDKRAILAVSLLALFSLVVLASAIKNVEFRPARHLSHEETVIVSIPVDAVTGSIANIPLGKQIALIISLFLFGILVVVLLPPEMRKRLLKQLVRMLLGILLLLYLLKIKPDILSNLFPSQNLGAGQGATPQVDAIPPPVFDPPQVSGWVSFVTAFLLFLLAALVFRGLYNWWMLRNQKTVVSLPLNEIAEAARTSLLNLSSTGSAQDKIIQCYADMSHVVDARRGLNREYAMTPAEFAVRLESAGLPPEPVKRLTRLFEAVRYGARLSGQGDVDEAIACLTSILKYCGEVVP
jgi:hypothetical protein